MDQTKNEKKKYWEFQNKSSDEADLYLYIEIASWGGGGYAHSAQSFKRELDALGDIKTLNVYINSPGGDVFEGSAIYNMLKRKAKVCNVYAYIDGLAASISSVIPMGVTKIFMPSNAMMMVHKAWCYTAGNSNDLMNTAQALMKIDTSIKQAYLDRAGDKLDDETITDLMEKETWLTARECLDYGLCDEVIDAKQVAAKFDDTILKNYKNVPENLRFDIAEEKPEETMKNIKDPVESQKYDIEAEKAKLLIELELI